MPHQVQPRMPTKTGRGCPGQLKDPRHCIVAVIACNACNAVQCKRFWVGATVQRCNGPGSIPGNSRGCRCGPVGRLRGAWRLTFDDFCAPVRLGSLALDLVWHCICSCGHGLWQWSRVPSTCGGWHLALESSNALCHHGGTETQRKPAGSKALGRTLGKIKRGAVIVIRCHTPVARTFWRLAQFVRSKS
jgi:hypothetical protein